MNTVITHFYNEEYMLPWWIKHHAKLFDNGIMINYHSTDRSVEICKELCPKHWTIVDSKNQYYETESVDREVINYEQSVEGFKIALTLTEFLFTPMSLADINESLVGYRYLKTYGVCMVDLEPEILPTYDKTLFEQKHHGMIFDYTATDLINGLQNNQYDILYGRYYHNQHNGNYQPGRHMINDNTGVLKSDSIFTLKYKYSPWNPSTYKRIRQFGPLVTDSEKQKKRGLHYLLTNNEHVTEYNHLMVQAVDLMGNEAFKTAFEYCNYL